MSDLPSPEAHVAAYGQLRARIIEMTHGIDRDHECPLTPEWSIGDTLAHLVGVNTDVIAGNLEGAPTPPWTAAQVDARRGRSTAELAAEWESNAEAFDAILLVVPTIVSGQVVFDTVTHEFDIAHALGAKAGQTSAELAIAAGWIAHAVKGRKADSKPAVSIDFGARSVQWGTGEVETRVQITEFEFVRVSSGRRSAAQILAAGYPSVEAALAAEIFSPSSFDVIE